MKTRRIGRGLRLALAALSLLAAGCGATSVKEKTAGQSTNEVPAIAGEVAVTNAAEVLAAASAPPTAAAPGGETSKEKEPPVQKSLRPSAALPEDVAKVVQLVESGAGEEVVRAYVGGADVRYELSLDQIIYLRDIGVSDGVIAAMMRRGSELREKDAESAALQTNLVSAVEQIKQGLASTQVVQNGASAGGAGAAALSGSAPQVPGAGVNPAGGEAPPAAVGQPGEVGAPAAPPVVVQTVQVPAEAPPAVQQFYTPLTQYGTWYQVPTYGWVWQPAVVTVDSTWMPYRHGGRWVWSNCGWYWCSDYSWGWAPFHYGRWCTYPGIGWCWVPDTVWGPSWVTWRSCDTYIGWAPLPPACGWTSGVGLTWHGGAVSVGFGFGLAHGWYTFVPSGRFCHRNLSQHAVRGADHDGAFRRSTVVNNVIIGDNNTIVNNGIGYNQVASRVRDEIPKARVEPLPAESRQALKADRLERSKDGFVVYRPTAVENAGGRPTLRSEVRPVSNASVAPTRSSSGIPVRPTAASGFSTMNPGSGKAVESRGGVPASGRPVSGAVVGAGATGSPVPRTATAPGRPVPTSRSSGVATPNADGVPSSGVARPYSTGGSGMTRAGEVRAIDSSGRPAGVSQPGPRNLAPVRETLPVPLSDPSKNMPTRSGQSMRSPGAAGVAPNAPMAAPAPTGGTVLPRGGYSTPAMNGAIPRPSAPSASPAPNLSAPRQSFSAPTPMPSSARPSFPTPSQVPSQAMPSPTYNSPRQSYSAPAPAPAASPAPVMSAPRPSYAAPVQAGPAPSAGNVAAPRGGGRNQQN